MLFAQTSPTSPRAPAGRGWRPSGPDLITIALALAIWSIFHPALMSPDSIAQYGQALTGSYDDWHPPLMAIVLHLVFAAGGGLGFLMLVQCVAGVFGIRSLAANVMRLLGGETLAPRRVEWLSLLVLLALLLPLSPLSFYLMTFWKDAWTMVLLLWLGALLLRLETARAPAAVRTGVVLTAAALAMVRHNSVLILPVAGLALWGALPPPRRWRGVALALAPAVVFALGSFTLERGFAVRKSQVTSTVMVLDLVALCASDPPACHALPWTESHTRNQPALADYHLGDTEIPIWKAMQPVATAMQTDRARLRAEYREAWRRFPAALVACKIEGFVSLLGLEKTHYFIQGSITDNPYRLALDGRLAPIRSWLERTAYGVADHPLLRWVSGVHALWLLVNAIGVSGSLALGRTRRNASLTRLGVVLLVPLVYYSSYLPVSTVRDFRFMYPATLFVQCVTLASLVGCWRRTARPAPPAP